MAIPIPQYTLSFSTTVTPGGVLQGIVQVVDTTDWAAAGIATSDVTIFIELADPTGNIFHPVNLLLPDINRGATASFQYGMPGNGASLPLPGNYTVSQYITRVVGPVSSGDYEGEPVTEEYCNDQPQPCIVQKTDCTYMWMTVTDSTRWPLNGWALVSRSMTLTFPANTPGSPAPITTTGSVITVQPGQLYTGTYGFRGTFVVTNGVTTSTLVVTHEYKPECVYAGGDMCSMLCCLETVFQRAYNNNAASMAEWRSKFIEMSSLLSMATVQSECGDGDALGATIKRFRALGQCTSDCGGDCGCSGSSDCGCDGTPKLLMPLHPGIGTGSTVVNIVQGPGINVSYDSGTSTWTISLADPGLLAAIRNTVVTGSDAITVSPPVVTPGSPPTWTYNVSTPWPRASMYWKETWNVQANARAMVGAPTIKGRPDVFTDTGWTPGAVGAYFWSYFPLAGSSPATNVHASARIVGWQAKAPYGTLLDEGNCGLDCIVKFLTPDRLTVSLVSNSGVFGFPVGQFVNMTQLFRFYNYLTIEFEIEEA